MKEGFEDRFTKYVSQNKDYDSPVVSTSPKGTKSPFSSTRITLETKLSTLPLSAHVTLGPRSILFSITKDWPGMRFIIQSARFSRGTLPNCFTDNIDRIVSETTRAGWNLSISEFSGILFKKALVNLCLAERIKGANAVSVLKCINTGKFDRCTVGQRAKRHNGQVKA